MSTSQPVLARLTDYLGSQRVRITDAWLGAVLEDSKVEAANLLTHKQLLDRLPDLFDQLCRFLRGRDATLLTGAVQDEARAHGHQRWEQGYAIDELLRELHVLRRIVLSVFVTAFAETDPDFARPAETTARNLVEEFFSSVIADSVRQFLGEQQEHEADRARRLEALNRQLEISNGRLKELGESRIQLTRSIAYGLRTFLQPVAVALAAVQSPGAEPVLAAAQTNVDDMEQLINQLLEYSAVLSQASAPAIGHFELAPLLDELVETFSALARPKGIGLKGALDARLSGVTSDRPMVRQIASSLLSNALQYAEEGDIALSFDLVEQDRWAITVSQTGRAAAPSDQGAAAEELAPGALSATGSGLGLAIAKEIAARLGGVVRATVWTGSGRRVEVVLPVRMTQE